MSRKPGAIQPVQVRDSDHRGSSQALVCPQTAIEKAEQVQLRDLNT